MASNAKSVVNETMEFASFTQGEQWYITRSIDVALSLTDSGMNPVNTWGRTSTEKTSIQAQIVLYTELQTLRVTIPESDNLQQLATFIGPLIKISAYDLGQDSLDTFGAYRFLYERLLSARVRRWLPSSFCVAAALPKIQPKRREVLLQSLSHDAATASGWSPREPVFFPSWVDESY